MPVKRKTTRRKRKVNRTAFHKWRKTRAQPWVTGRGIFGDIGRGFKTLFTNPGKLIRGYKILTKKYGSNAFNPFTGKLGMASAIKGWVDKKDPRHDAMHNMAKPLFKPLEYATKLDPTGIASKGIEKIEGMGKKRRRVVRRKRRKLRKK